MAANQSNMSTGVFLFLHLPPQGTWAPLQAPQQAAHDAEKLQRKMSTDERRRAFRQAMAHLCEDLIASTCAKDACPDMLTKFTVFPKLPTELRLKIWNYAIDTPRFVELLLQPNANSLEGVINNSSFENVPLGIFLACKESHEVVKHAYELHPGTKAEEAIKEESFAQWIRFDKDIIHFKPNPEFPSMLQHDGLNSQANRSTDKWSGRPSCFDKIKNLAISRDVLQHLPDDAEPFIRHFFSNLLTLLILIDEQTDIDDAWDIHDSDYSRYDRPLRQELRIDSNPMGVPRVDFAMKCKGPFKEVRVNIDYRFEVEFEMRERFEKEEEKYNFYTAPRVRVLGAFVPEGVEVKECGRLPFSATEARKIKCDVNPFGNFSIEGQSQRHWRDWA